MAKSALSFSGTLYAAPLDGDKNLIGGYRRIGNVYPFALKVDTEQKKMISAMRESAGQTLHTKNRITEITGSMTVREWDARNFAWALSGEEQQLTGSSGTVTAESVTLVMDEFVRLAHKDVSNVVISGSVLGTDYEVNAALGLIRAIPGGNLTAGPKNVDYAYAAESGYRVNIGTKTMNRVAIMIDGENLESGDPVNAEFDSVVLASSTEVNLISEPDSDFDEMPFALSFETKSGNTTPGHINGVPL